MKYDKNVENIMEQSFICKYRAKRPHEFKFSQNHVGQIEITTDFPDLKSLI